MSKVIQGIIAVLAVGLVGAVLLVFAYPLTLPDYDATASRFSNDLDQVDLVARGKYLATAGNCASCHTSDQGFLAGGVAFDTPFGKVYSTNITPDADTGLGDWSLSDFFLAMRHGLGNEQEHLYPVFPYTFFTKMTDEDIAALFAYLQNVPPTVNHVPKSELSFPFNQRRLLAIWKVLYLDAGVFRPMEAESTQWNRGSYLVNAISHCGACHSPRNSLGGRVTPYMSGGVYQDKVPGGQVRTWSTPNLTSASVGLGIWPHQELTAYLKTGVNTFVDTFGPMNKVIMDSTRYLYEKDLDAMATYLKSLPPQEVSVVSKPDNETLGMGKTLYSLHCGTCHLPTGLGDPEMGPRLGQGSLVVRAPDPSGLINVILYGPQRPSEPLPSQRRDPMDAFQYELDDHEVAALATYVRASWGNNAGSVTPKQVAAQR